MGRMRRRSRNRRLRGFLLLALLLLGIGIFIVPHVRAEKRIISGLQSQIFNDDLTVKKGQVYEEDVSVYDGDVTVEDGGVIQGNLYVYSGDVEVEEGGQVKGNIAAFSGSVKIGGAIDGRVAAWSGDIELTDSASVGGDVSVLSGHIERAPEARVRGNVVSGPNFKVQVPEFFKSPFGNGPGEIKPVASRAGLGGTLLGFILRLFGAAVLTILVALLAWLLYTVRPDIVRQVRATAEEQPALSFAVGAIVNIGLLFVAFLFFVTICLIPFGLAVVLVLAVLNLVGWSATALWVGEWLRRYTRSSAQPVAYMLLGVLVTSGAVGLLWAFGCWRTCLVLIVLLASAPGVGALLVPWLKLGRQPGTGGNPPAGPSAPIVPVAPVTPVVTTEVVTPVDVAAETDPATTPEVSVATPAEESTPPVTTPEQQLTDSTGVSAEPTAEAETNALPMTSDLETLTSDAAPLVTPEPADFTQIRGIGQTFDARFKAAGIHFFGQLAVMTPEAVAAVLGLPVQQVIDDNILGQAKTLAER